MTHHGSEQDESREQEALDTFEDLETNSAALGEHSSRSTWPQPKSVA
jgi:hypothetical protein